MPYEAMTTPHVRFRQETITAIDPSARRVTTDLDTYEADVLVVALGADYDLDATPGLVETRQRVLLGGRRRAAARRAADLHVGHRDRRCVRCAVQVPAGAQRGGHPARRVPAGARPARRRPHPGGDPLRGARAALARDLGGDPRALRRARDRVHAGAHGRRPRVRGPPCSTTACVFPATCSSGSRCTGRPPWWRPRAWRSRAGSPSSRARSPRASRTSTRSATSTSVGTAKAGVFAEGAGRVVAEQLIARLRGDPEPPGYDGTGTVLHRVRRPRGGSRRCGLLLDARDTRRARSPSPRRRPPRRRRPSPPAGALAGSAADPPPTLASGVAPSPPTVVLPRAHDRRPDRYRALMETPNTDALWVEGLRKTFDATDDEQIPVRALRGLDLAVAHGAFVAIMGPSGLREVDPPEPRGRARDADDGRRSRSTARRSTGRIRGLAGA